MDDARRVEDLVDYWPPLLVRACGEHGVFDRFGPADRTTVEVAAELGWDAAVLGRVVRALTARGLFEATGDGRHRLTALGRRLVRGVPGSLAGMAAFRAWEVHAWAEVVHALRTGEPSFDAHFGRSYWEYLDEHPDVAESFDVQMQRRTLTLLEPALDAYDWPAEGTVVDVGGGNGLLLQRVLRLRPALAGVLFDLPAVVARAAPLDEPDVRHRARAVGGDVFVDDLPAGADVYVLSSVLHDWSDGDAVRILGRCRRAMAPSSRLVLFESVLPEGPDWDLGKLVDLHMHVLFGAKERTEGEWRSLVAEAGFGVTRVVPTPGLSWIEAVPA